MISVRASVSGTAAGRCPTPPPQPPMLAAPPHAGPSSAAPRPRHHANARASTSSSLFIGPLLLRGHTRLVLFAPLPKRSQPYPRPVAHVVPSLSPFAVHRIYPYPKTPPRRELITLSRICQRVTFRTHFATPSLRHATPGATLP